MAEPESVIQPPPPTPSQPEPEDSPAIDELPKAAAAGAKMSFSIWPPAERTRQAVVARLVETLSAPSVLSKRYGTLSQGEASSAARAIEDEAFAVAADSAESDDDGIQILQVYSKEISKRMLDAVKARSASAEDPKVETEAS